MKDIHVHTDIYDEETNMQNYVEKAKQYNMDEITFVDYFDPDDRLKQFNFVDYYKSFLKAKNEDVRCNLGIEMFMTPESASKIDYIVECYPFDFVIGINKVASLESLLESIKAHRHISAYSDIDLLFKYSIIQNEKKAKEQLDRVLDEIVSRNKGILVNSQGLNSNVNINKTVLRKYRDLGGKNVTVGSGCYSPNNLGRGMDETLSFLQELGYDEVVVYRDRHAYPEKIKSLKLTKDQK